MAKLCDLQKYKLEKHLKNSYIMQTTKRRYQHFDLKAALLNFLLFFTLITSSLHASPSISKTSNNKYLLEKLVARSFVHNLLKGDFNAALALCAKRIHIEDSTISDIEELEQNLRKMHKRANARDLKLMRVEIKNYQQMLKEFGKPPKRLIKNIRHNDRFALLHFNRGGAILGLRHHNSVIRIYLISD